MSSLTDYSVNDTPMMMDIRSDTLEPITGVQGTSRRFVFRLDQAGYLDSNSMLLFKLQGAVNNTNRVNCWNGGLGAIKRATFQVGDFVINDTDGASEISTLMNLASVPPSVKNQYWGWFLQNQLHNKVLDGDVDTLTQYVRGALKGGTGSICADKAKSGMSLGDQSNNNAGAAINSCRISNTQATNQQIGIPLGMVFPALKGRTIPLFLFQDYRILLSFEFHDGSEFTNDITQVGGTAVNNATGGNPGMQGLLGCMSYHDVKLQVDYVIMPAEIQNKDRMMTNQDGGLRLDFLDSIRVEKQLLTTTAGAEQEVEHRIGADNKEVHKIYMTKRFTDTAVRNKREQTAIFLQQRCDAINQEEYNVNIDGINVFHDWKWSPTSQYDEASNCLGKDMKVARPTYCYDDNTIFNGLTPHCSGLGGQYKPLCLDLGNGNPGVLGSGRNIGAYPIIWKYKRKPTATIGDTIFAMNGPMEVNYYMLVSKTATIRSTPMGTNVMVSY
tara:strand:- start:2342 stop:3835 length:1494 start_codon:yes stop_codon:yes gene_type:complete